MRYLVKAEYVDPGPLLPQPQGLQLVEETILPSLEALGRLDREGKITGGLFVGGRGGAFVLEAASNEEAHEVLGDLPFWGVCRWEVTPLEAWHHRVEYSRPQIDEIKALLGL
ncbi:MAG: hypothetical protein L0206_22185 [Actinobacteria bacterium]|nr:hypothetical protein [Actinomycetota bacterium]